MALPKAIEQVVRGKHVFIFRIIIINKNVVFEFQSIKINSFSFHVSFPCLFVCFAFHSAFSLRRNADTQQLSLKITVPTVHILTLITLSIKLRGMLRKTGKLLQSMRLMIQEERFVQPHGESTEMINLGTANNKKRDQDGYFSKGKIELKRK